jgi:putative peptidoglycan lipid II flippase
VLLPTYGLFSLMIADSVKHFVHALTSAWLLSRRMNGFGSQRLLITLLKTGAAALALGVVAQIGEPVLESLIGTDGTLREAVLVTSIGALSGAAFIVVAVLVRVEELGWLWGLLRARLRRS